MNYYYSIDGKAVLGPCPAEELTARHSRGELPITAQVCAEGTQTWQPITALVGGVPPPAPPPVPQQGDATGGLIPYKNPHALIGYYLGIFGLFPFIGLLLAIPALILGIMGLQRRKKNPIIKGAVHAWVGIVLGAISILYNSALVLAIGATAMSHHR
jgi:hypothetical protein